MSKTLEQAGPKVHVADIVHHGEKMILPEGMSLDDGIDLLMRRKKYLTEKVVLSDTFDVFPWDGAHALDRVLARRYGWTTQEPTPGFFGDNPPRLINIEVGPKKHKKVPWGAFSLPKIKGLLHTQVQQKGNRAIFGLAAEVTRGDETVVQEIFDAVRVELEANSIYRGKAFRMKFLNDDDEPEALPTPSFIDTDSIDPDMLVYSEEVRNAIETNLFTPITRAADCIANKIPLKRGILLGGPYGTGKTLAANVAAKLAVENGITYLYIPNTKELPRAIEFARQYQSPACVVFCEDIDRVTVGERDEAMDEILNTIDGIDSKDSNIIVVLTTNHLNDINPAMMRPGRLDAVIEVSPPDAEAVVKLVRVYGGKAIDPKADLTEVGTTLDGHIPAVIAEAVKRAKLSQLKLTPPGEKVSKISAPALLDAAKTMNMQLKLLNRPKEKKVDTLEQRLYKVVGAAQNGEPIPEATTAH